MSDIINIDIHLSVDDKSQDQKESFKAEAIAQKLANPNAILGFLSLPIDFITCDGDLPDVSPHYKS